MNGKFIVFDKKYIINICLILVLAISLSIVGIDFIGDSIEVINKNRLLPIYSVETAKKQVSLTFDCAWGADDISQIIAILSENNVKATFFTVGDWVLKNPKAVENLNKAGMEIRKPYVKSCTCCTIIV